MAAVAAAVGPSNVAIRLEPTGLYNGTYGTERVETWSHLCEQLALAYQGDNKLSYVHFIEPRLDRVADKGHVFDKSWNLPRISNEPFRSIIKGSAIPCLSCGAWDAINVADAIEAQWDMVAFAKWFVSNPDLPERIRRGKQLQAYDRSRFYGSWDGVRENGYIDYKTWEEEVAQRQQEAASKGLAESNVTEVINV